MPYLIFALIYLATTVAYLFFRTAQYRANVLIDGSKTDTLAMYTLLLKFDLPFFLAWAVILMIAAIAIAVYRKAIIDIAYALIMVAGLFFAGDLIAATFYGVLS